MYDGVEKICERRIDIGFTTGSAIEQGSHRCGELLGVPNAAHIKWRCLKIGNYVFFGFVQSIVPEKPHGNVSRVSTA